MFIQTKGPTPDAKAQEEQSAAYRVLARLHDEANTRRQWLRSAIRRNDAEAIQSLTQQLAEYEAQARTLEQAVEEVHWETLAQAEAAEVLAQPPMTDEELDRWEQEQVNAAAARRGR